MGLYLAIFDGDEEIEGVEVGSYSDFGALRRAVVNTSAGLAESLYPTLIRHSDGDGVWSTAEAEKLAGELEAIAARFRKLPPIEVQTGWKTEVMKQLSMQPKNLYDCFFDVDGEPLLDRLLRLTKVSAEMKLPILFQ